MAVTFGADFVLNARDALVSRCTRETNYFCIKVYDQVRDGFAVRTLVLDHLVHSYVKLGDPSYLGYEHEYVQAEVTRFVLAGTGVPNVLQIGGGGAAVWVVAGSAEGIDLDRMREFPRARGLGPMRTPMLEPERLRACLADGPPIVLTDEYAPVDNLIAPLFTRRG